MIGSERVQQILEQTHNFATINSPSNTEAINKLISLRNFLQSQEQIFYDSIGVHNIQGLNKLLSKIDSIRNLSALDAGGIVYNYINEHYVFQGQKNNEFNSYVGENIFDLFTELLNEHLDEFCDEIIKKEEKNGLPKEQSSCFLEKMKNLSKNYKDWFEKKRGRGRKIFKI